MSHATHVTSLPAQKTAALSGDRRRLALVLATLACLTFLAYLPALRAGFVFDDNTYLTGNPLMRSTAGLRDIWLRPSASPQYYPLTFTSFWIEYRLWHLDPVGYHFDNALLHVANAVLLYYLLKRLRVPGAWLVAAIFAVHPINVESVAWIVERKNVLSLFFYLLAALAYLRYAGVLSGAGPGRWWLCLIALFCLTCSLLAKSVTATWPFAMLLIVWWRTGRLSVRNLVPLFPALAIVVASGTATWWIEKNQVGARGPEFAWSFADSLIIAGRAFWFYAGKLLWPLHLCFVYPRWAIDSGHILQYLYPLTAVATIVILWLLRGRIGRGPVAAALLFGITLSPALGLVKVYAMRYSFVADHWAYHAAPAFIALIVASLAEVTRRLQWRASLAGGAGAAAVAILAVLTNVQARHFNDIETFWRAVIRTNPKAWMAQNNLGQYLLAQKRVSEAEQCLSEAVRLKPDNYVALTNLGVAYFGQNRPDKAAEQYRAALAVNPDYVLARNHLGVALFQQGRIDDAIHELQQAVDLKPDYAPAQQHLAMVLEYKRDFAQAITHYEAALAAEPDNAVVCNNLAWLLATAPEPALRNGRRALDLARRAGSETGWKQPNMLGTFAAALAENGEFDQALQAAQTARQIAEATRRNDLLGQLDDMIHSLENRQPIRVGSPPASAPAGNQASQSSPAQ